MKQESLLGNEFESHTSGPVECLGMTFENDEARRAHFTELLKEKLKDPEFRAIEGFPIGTDEAILELSDPPYYTACPNPWLNDFVKLWESQKTDIEDNYHREPFAADVSEGKNDPIYNAHSYHTKVPHKAIMRYILHYTKPGDIVFDGFCGTGMTGVAAQMCGDRNAVEELGFQIDHEGNISEKNSEGVWSPFSRLGVRHAVLNDLSPAASFISHNYNTPVHVPSFEREAIRILEEVEKECGWMYETKHIDGRLGKINYTVWSDVFVCQECSGEVVFWDEAVDARNGKVRDEFPCPHCHSNLSKKTMDRAWSQVYDPALGDSIRRSKQVPVQINYSVQGLKGRFEKQPDQEDIVLIEKIDLEDIPYWYPSIQMPKGDKTSDPFRVNVTHSHQFYTKRNLRVLATLRNKLRSSPLEGQLLCLVGDQLPRASKMHKIAVSRLNTNLSKTAGVLAGTLYIPSNQIEYNINSMIGFRIKDVASYQSKRDRETIQPVSIGSCSATTLPDSSVDYLFFDPPFGANLMYSELNFLWESWLNVMTNNKSEAIENKTQKKTLNDYRDLMCGCFKEAYRVLKPGRWLTVEFSNTKASVWNSIQSAMTESGFVVANVSALDKKQGTFNAVTNTTSVKQDLVITAYKPDLKFSADFENGRERVEHVWDFIRSHLSYLPVVKFQGNELSFIPERDPRILFDRVVSYYVRKGYPVPISSRDFQLSLSSFFIEEDGMYFLNDQAVEYRKAKKISGFSKQLSIFVDDEVSAIDWLTNELKGKPKTYSEIHPLFLHELSGWKKNELSLELITLLDQNFIKYDGEDEVPSQIHTYLSTNFKDMRGLQKNDPKLKAKAKDRWYVPDPNKAADLEKVRLRALLKEFEIYKAEKKKIKQPRAEALRAGFNSAWESQDFQTILDVSAKIPPAVLQEDEKLLMFYDNALTLTTTEDDEW
ncbi:DNA methyltransferase [Vibrio cholerae]